MTKLNIFVVLTTFIIICGDTSSACESAKSINFRELPQTIDTSEFLLSLNGRIAKEDLRKIDFTSSLDYVSRILSELQEKILRAGQDIPRVVSIINEEFNARVLYIEDDILAFDVDNIGRSIENRTISYLNRELKDNRFIEYSVIKLVESQLRAAIPKIKELIEGKGVPVADLALRMEANPKFRACSLNLIQIAFKLIRWQLGNLLVPIQTIVVGTFTNITEYILTYYVATESANPILASITACTNSFVLNIASVVVTVKETVNVVFNYAIYGTSIGIVSSEE